jgi:hypothetical protein
MKTIATDKSSINIQVVEYMLNGISGSGGTRAGRTSYPNNRVFC